MEGWYLLITGKFLFLTFRRWEIRSFLSQKVDGKVILAWSFWDFHDIPGAKKNGFSCSTFFKCITKIDGTTTDDAEDLDLAMPLNNLLECSLNHCNPTGILWFYSKDQAANFNNEILIILILSCTLFFYKSNFIRTWASYLTKS